MTPFSFSTENNPEWDKKMSLGLLKEVEALTGNSADFKTHNIYIKNEDTFVGGISVEPYGDILWIDSIWVEPDFRKQGIGRMLLLEANFFATKNKAKEIQLNTYFAAAHAFFLTCGFEEVAKIPNWKWDLTCYLMRKRI